MDYNFTPSYLSIQKSISSICKNYDFVKQSIIGFSHCKRKITALSIGNPDKQVLFAAAFHSMEAITSLLVLKFFEHCCERYKNNTVLFKRKAYETFSKTGLTVIACVNPDGVEIFSKGSKSAMPFKLMIDSVTSDTSRWQANAAGVDLNHNFDAGWHDLKKLEIKNGITKPSPTRFGGNRPFSEPETRAVKKYCETQNIDRCFAFHSQGREIYYDFGKNTPDKSESYAQSLAKLCDYTVSRPEGLAVGGGFKDWFIERFNKPAFTVEIGKGTNPLPISDLKSEYIKILNMLCFAVETDVM